MPSYEASCFGSESGGLEPMTKFTAFLLIIILEAFWGLLEIIEAEDILGS